MTGTYWLWDGEETNGRTRITNRADRVGAPGQVTGWIDVSDARAALTGGNADEPANGLRTVQIGPIGTVAAMPIWARAQALGLGYRSEWTDATQTEQLLHIGPSSEGDVETLRQMAEDAGAECTEE